VIARNCQGMARYVRAIFRARNMLLKGATADTVL
jgi:hypothetical protein